MEMTNKSNTPVVMKETKKKILEYCKEYLDVFERPKEIIFKDELPKTLVGKVAYRELEKQEFDKLQK